MFRKAATWSLFCSAFLLLATTPSPPAGAADNPGTIYFQREIKRENNGDLAIWSMKPNGGRLRRLTRTPFTGGGSGDQCPTATTKGVFFTRADGKGRNGSDQLSRAFRMRANGSHLRRVAKTRLYCPSVSANGAKLAYSNDEDGFYLPRTRGIMTMSTSSTRAKRVIRGSADNYAIHPNYSDDGRRIAFVREHDSTTYSISIADSDGRNERVVYSSDTNDVKTPSISPDGKTIAFSCGSGTTDPYGVQPGLCVVNQDGTGYRQLIEQAGKVEGNQKPRVFYPNTRKHTEPDWSPTGRQLVFSCGREYASLCVINADGTGRKTVGIGSDASWK